MRPSLLTTPASDLRIQTVRLMMPVVNNGGFPELGLRAALPGRDTRFDTRFDEERPVTAGSIRRISTGIPGRRPS